MLIGVLNSRPGVSEIRGKPEVPHTQASLEALFLYVPFRRTVLVRERPFIESRRHEGFIAAEIDKRTNSERAYELPSPYGSCSWHCACASSMDRSESQVFISLTLDRIHAIPAGQRTSRAVRIDVPHRAGRRVRFVRPVGMLLLTGGVHHGKFLCWRPEIAVL